MTTHKLLPVLIAFTLLAGAGTLTRAETSDDMSFSGMFTSDRIGARKDTMMKKADFLAMAGKAWDMKAKEMKLQGDAMNATQYADFTRFLSRGEKNK